MIKTYYIKYPWRGFWSGMLLITGNSGNVLIDTAYEDAIGRSIVPLLDELGMTLDSIKLIVNTHSHEDHVAGNQKLRELTHAKFAVHRERPTGFVSDILLSDGMILEQDDIRLEIIHTPGHSPDSICVLELSSGTLFSGDSIQGCGSMNIGLALYQNPEIYRESMLKIRERCLNGDIRQIILGHPELPSNGVVEKTELLSFMNATIQTVDDYTQTTLALLKEHPEAEAAELRDLLLKRDGVSLTPSWPELSYLTAEAHLRAARNRAN